MTTLIASELTADQLGWIISDTERAAMVEDLCTDADHALILAARRRGSAVATDLYGAA